jgi:membrane protease YdiL (CAAX protease family)
MVVQPGVLASFEGLPADLLVGYLAAFVVVFFGGGPLGEEVGWRGFALPRMQPRFGPLRATLLLGFLWCFWHLPDFLDSAAQGGGPGTGTARFLVNFSLFSLVVMSLAVIMTWVFNQTRGSLLIALLLHASVNTPQLALVRLFPAVDFTKLDLAGVIAFGLPALLIVAITRGRLAFDRSA